MAYEFYGTLTTPTGDVVPSGQFKVYPTEDDAKNGTSALTSPTDFQQGDYGTCSGEVVTADATTGFFNIETSGTTARSNLYIKSTATGAQPIGIVAINALDVNEAAAGTPELGDYVLFRDGSDGTIKKCTLTDVAALLSAGVLGEYPAGTPHALKLTVGTGDPPTSNQTAGDLHFKIPAS